MGHRNDRSTSLRKPVSTDVVESRNVTVTESRPSGSLAVTVKGSVSGLNTVLPARTAIATAGGPGLPRSIPHAPTNRRTSARTGYELTLCRDFPPLP